MSEVTLTPIDSIPQEVRVSSGRRAINPDKVPKWATELVTQVCSDYDLEVPPIRWRERKPMKVTVATGEGVFRQTRIVRSSSGLYCHKDTRRGLRIVVTAGSYDLDQRVVLLHELAHHRTPKRKHTYTFWEAAWDLYGKYLANDNELKYTYSREVAYRVKSGQIAPLVAHSGRGVPVGPYYDILESEPVTPIAEVVPIVVDTQMGG